MKKLLSVLSCALILTVFSITGCVDNSGAGQCPDFTYSGPDCSISFQCPAGWQQGTPIPPSVILIAGDLEDGLLTNINLVIGTAYGDLETIGETELGILQEFLPNIELTEKQGIVSLYGKDWFIYSHTYEFTSGTKMDQTQVLTICGQNYVVITLTTAEGKLHTAESGLDLLMSTFECS